MRRKIKRDDQERRAAKRSNGFLDWLQSCAVHDIDEDQDAGNNFKVASCERITIKIKVVLDKFSHYFVSRSVSALRNFPFDQLAWTLQTARLAM
jgi:hypothetical protein